MTKTSIILLCILLAFIIPFSIALKDAWYVAWILAAMIVLGYFRTRHLTDWAEDENKDHPEKKDQ